MKEKELSLEEEAKAFKARSTKERTKEKDLTLLDFFAGQAMTGLLSAGTFDLDYLKKESYRIAEKFIED